MRMLQQRASAFDPYLLQSRVMIATNDNAVAKWRRRKPIVKVTQSGQRPTSGAAAVEADTCVTREQVAAMAQHVASRQSQQPVLAVSVGAEDDAYAARWPCWQVLAIGLRWR